VELTAQAGSKGGVGPPVSVTIHLGITNTGDRAAERVAVNIVVPRELRLRPGGKQGHGNISRTESHDVGRGPEPCIYWNAVLGPFDPEIAHVAASVQVWEPRPGTYPIYLELMHDDIPARARAELWELVIPPSSDADVEIRRTRRDVSLWRPAQSAEPSS
jgi:hypothetical protein